MKVKGRPMVLKGGPKHMSLAKLFNFPNSL